MRWLLALAVPVLCCAQQATFSLSSANIKPGHKGFLDLRIDSRVSVAIEWAIELPPNVVVVAVSQRAGSRRAAKLLSCDCCEERHCLAVGMNVTPISGPVARIHIRAFENAPPGDHPVPLSIALAADSLARNVSVETKAGLIRIR